MHKSVLLNALHEAITIESPLLQANYDQSVNEPSLRTIITIVLVYPTYL